MEDRFLLDTLFIPAYIGLMNFVSTLFLTFSMQLAMATNQPSLTPVPYVDLSRYLGKWYEIARFPNFFQKDCDQATAEYSLIEEGKIQVINTCKGLKDGRLTSVTGIATVEDPVTHAKLKVNFVPSWLRWTGIGSGDYWIIDLDEDYTYAVVSEPNRKYLWILSRTATLSQGIYNSLLNRLRDEAFDVSRLIPSR